MRRGSPTLDLPGIKDDLSPHEANGLMLLAQAPLLSAEAAHSLAGFGSNASAYRTLKRLADRGLISSLRPPGDSVASPLLHYLTETGIAAVAHWHGLDARHLARRYRLRREDIARRVDALPHLSLLYTLAASLVPEGGRLRRWVNPWRRRYYRFSAKSIQRVSLPAYAELEMGAGEVFPVLLLPHAKELPLSAFASAVRRVGEYAAFCGGDVPDLVVATDKRQVDEWEALLNAPGVGGVLRPLPGYVFTWEEVSEGLASVVQPRSTVLSHFPDVPVKSAEAPGSSQSPGQMLGRRRDGVAGDNLTSPDRQLLDLIARHPFLAVDDLAIVMGWTPDKVSRARTRMLRGGLLRELDASETMLTDEAPRSELTTRGLGLLAAGVGLTPTRTVAALGLSGGGPDQPFGQRAALVRTLEHTVGVIGVFVGLYRVIASWRRAGFEYRVSNWRSAAACARRGMRPDGRGELWLGEVLYDFFLEYDRATESESQLIWKFDAYRRFYEDSGGPPKPTLLVVTRDAASETRIARAILTACAGWGRLLPVLITTEQAVGSDRDGLLGRIWREPVDRGRRHWLLRPPRVTTLGFGLPPSESHRWTVDSTS